MPVAAIVPARVLSAPLRLLLLAALNAALLRLQAPNWVTWSLQVDGEDLLRSLQPEASFVLGNRTVLVGGADGTTSRRREIAILLHPHLPSVGVFNRDAGGGSAK